MTREGRSFPASPGTKVRAGDTLVTGHASSLGIILRDDSTLSLGEDTTLVLRDFDFSPAEAKLGILVRISRGTMAYLSGLIGKLAPEAARFETPVATIGIRGTRFAVKVGQPVPE
ncbi:MAG: FecR domain-containing protein [Verrucomicrobiota bacterium]